MAGTDPVVPMPQYGAKDFSALIGAIGESSFARDVLSFAHQLCGASHTSVFHVRCGATASIASMAPASIDGSNTAHLIADRYLAREAWRHDPALREARARLRDDHGLMLHNDLSSDWGSQQSENVYGNGMIADRLLIYGKCDDDIVGVGFLRTARTGCFSAGDIERMGNILEPLLAISKKHVAMTESRVDASEALTSMDEIVASIDRSPVHFPRREAEVCARIIHGVGTAGIAAELGISEETVLTYRKRIYSRLEIATQRELLIWHLRGWSLSARQEMRARKLH